ncbi:DUF4232 domain-containing protein [Streptomyces sp. NPDC056670]|uniref:DUF4232 domain-containing protein n=1 Tax=Streptomyces sp. NPDC056670 TaxID=3345904 RepID=UPI00368C3451
MTAFTNAATLILVPALLTGATTATAYAETGPTQVKAACAPAALGYEARARAPIASSVVLITITNKSGAACTIDRFPSVTFGDLDGSARPVPATQSGPRQLAAKGKLYAALRTDDRSSPARYVRSLAVSAEPAAEGTRFTARQIGAPATGIAVYDPITTLWKQSVDEAVASLPAS